MLHPEERERVIPTIETTIRLSKLFRRRPTTAWSEKEFRVYKRLYKGGHFDTLEDLELIERYYAFERAKRDDRGVHRRDLYTLLYNWPGEVDRAREWERKHPPQRKIIPIELPANLPPLSADEIAAGEKFMEHVRQRKQAKGTA